MNKQRTAPRRAAAAVFVVMLLLVAGCRQDPPGPVSPSGGTPMTTPPTSDPTPGEPPTAGSALSVVVLDGAGGRTHWTLTCDPVGGTHPDPTAACAALTAHGERALPAVRKDRACTQIYGGPQTASVTGTWAGAAVRSSFSLKNGCEIARWKMLQGLLPPAGS